MVRYRRRGDPAARWLIGLLSILLVGAAGFLVWLTRGSSPYDGVDEVTYCREEGPRSVTVVLIDATDPLTPQQEGRLIIELTKLREQVPRFDRLVLFAIDAAN